MATSTRIYLVRHGAVDNPGQIPHGRRPGFPLSDEGQRQAAAAAARLAEVPLSAVFTSPQLRTRQTAHAIAADRPAQVTPLLDEVDSFLDGRPLDELAARNFDLYTGRTPGHEGPEDVVARARAWLAEARARHDGEQVLGVTHGDVIALLILWARGQPPDPIAKQRLARADMTDDYPAPASITSLEFATADPAEIPACSYQRPY